MRCGAVELVEHSLVEALDDSVRLRALGLCARVVDVLDRQIELVFVVLRIVAKCSVRSVHAGDCQMFCVRSVLGPVDRLDGGQNRLAVLPGHERQAVADQVHDAGLNYGLWIDRRRRRQVARNQNLSRPSKLPPRSHGTAISISPSSVRIVFALEPRLGKALEPVDHGDQDVVDAA
jgi:hypothetical protein